MNIWGNVAVLAYVAPGTGGIQTATAGMTFTWQPEGFPGPMAVERYMAPDPSAKTEYIEAQYFGDEKVTAVTCVLAAQDLARTLPWFAASVRDVRMMRIEELNDLMPAVEQAADETQ